MRKSEEEIKYLEALDRYEKRFGERYPRNFFEFSTFTEVIKDINRRLRTGERKELPTDDPDIVY